MKDKDHEILYFVREFHLITEKQLAELTGRRTLWRRLPVLTAEKKLYRKRRSVYAPFVYAAHNIIKRTQFEHDLMITEIHIALYKTGRLVDWRQSTQKLKGALNEDAFCAISAGSRQLRCFIEADNASEPDWQIREKVERYIAYHQETRERFRTLFVAPDDRRSCDLLRAARRVVTPDTSRIFLFVGLGDYKRDCLGPVCRLADDQQLVPMVPIKAV